MVCSEYCCVNHSERCGNCCNSLCDQHKKFCDSCGRSICELNDNPCLKKCEDCGQLKCCYCLGTCVNGKKEWVNMYVLDIWRAIKRHVQVNDKPSINCSCKILKDVFER